MRRRNEPRSPVPVVLLVLLLTPLVRAGPVRFLTGPTDGDAYDIANAYIQGSRVTSKSSA